MPQKNEQQLNYRAASIKPTGPKTLDREKRSLEFVISTEDPVVMYDWERGDYVPEVLLAKGAIMPKQVPLLDTHDRYSVKTVLGSVRKKKKEDGLVSGTAIFSSVPAAEEALTKYEEGHLTDFSAGYRNNNVTRIKKGEKVEIDGRTWKGPMNVVTSWTIKEASCCPIGADPKAKARSDKETTITTTTEIHTKELDMADETRMEKLEESVGKISDAVSALAGSIAEQNKKRQEADDVDEKIVKMRKTAIRTDELVTEKERERIQEIRAVTEKLSISTGVDFDEIRTELINDGSTFEQAYKRCLDRIATARPEDLTSGIRIGVGKEDKEKSHDAAIDGLMIRSGIQVDQVQDRDTEYQTMNLLELAKNRCLTFGQSVRGLDQMQIFERALSTSDFDNILADVANKAMLEGFENANETYDVWVDTTGRVNDFKDHVFARASEAPSFVAINPEGGEYKYGSMTDAKETVAVTDYGIIVPFTRKAMVNDDLSALSDIKEKLGVAARRKFGDLCYAVLTGTVTMGDGNSLWDATNHSNYTASGAAPNVAGLNTGATAMATQKDIKGVQNLNIVPEFILTPWALKGTTDNLLTTTTPIAPGSAASPVTNPWSHLKPVHESRLDAASAAIWYLMARKGMTVQLFTLNGNTTPKLDMRMDWSTDSLDFKGRITGAAKAKDWRGMYKNAGA
jgi:hypothetical protein